MTIKILAFAGSNRRDSLNKRLARLAARHAEVAGAEVCVLDLADYPMPLYDGDLEAESGPPPTAFQLRELIAAHDGVLIASPEYNNSLPALLKNTLDWVSRTPRVSGSNPFAGKPAALLAASPGSLGGLRGLDHLRRVLDTLGMLVLPGVAAIPAADRAFDADGALLDARLDRRVAELSGQLVDLARRLRD